MFSARISPARRNSWTAPSRRASFLFYATGEEKEPRKTPRGRQKEAPPRPIVGRGHYPGLGAGAGILVYGGDDAGEGQVGDPPRRPPGTAGGRYRAEQRGRAPQHLEGRVRSSAGRAGGELRRSAGARRPVSSLATRLRTPETSSRCRTTGFPRSAVTRCCSGARQQGTSDAW